MNEYEIEPVRGLPGQLPSGERILWQGAPEPLVLARSAFHARGVAIYFALLTTVALVIALARGSSLLGTAITGGLGIVAVGLLHLLGWAAARASVYTLTNRRLVLRIGIALPTCLNLPLGRIAAIDLSGGGDIALRLSESPPLGWVALWPHARPWRLARPEPMLRALTAAPDVAAQIARACQAAAPAGRIAPAPVTATPSRAPLQGVPDAVAA